MELKNRIKLKMSIENYMKKHIGFQNGTTIDDLLEIGFPEKQELIHKSYKRKLIENWEYSSLKNKIKPILRRMRKDLETFTIAQNAGGEWVYFIIKTKQEADTFAGRMESNVKGIRNTEKRAYEAIKNRNGE